MTVAGKRLLGIIALILTVGLVILAVISGVRARSWRLRVNGLAVVRQQRASRVGSLDAAVAALEAQLKAAGAREPVPGKEIAPRHPFRVVTDLDGRISELEASLKTAGNTLSEQQFRGQQLDDQIARASAETRKLTEKEAELRKRVADAEGVVAAMESELNGKDSRLTPLELSARSLRTGKQTALDALERQVAPARAIEDIERRRETYLSGILGRYRQLVDQSRFLSLRPENPAGANPAATLDLSRLQSVVSQAEEEYRQIQALDAQAQLLLDRIQKQH
jgi:chromosome segregation ATPase